MIIEIPERFCLSEPEEIDVLQERVRELEESERFWEDEARRFRGILTRLKRRVLGADASIRSASELLEQEEF